MELEHYVKLLKKGLSDSDKERFVKLVKELDPEIETYYDDGGAVIVETCHPFSNDDVNQLFKKCESYYDDFFIMASSNEDLDESKEEPKEDKSIYDQMFDELEVQMHNRVMEKKTKLGWRHGDKFDPHEKTSPLLKPYHQLPEEYKIKNGQVFMDVIDILKKHGFKVSLPKKN